MVFNIFSRSLLSCLLALAFAGSKAQIPSLVKDINTTNQTQAGYSYILGETGNLMVILAEENMHGQEPWITDGSTANTRLLYDIRANSLSSNVRAALPYGDKVIFLADDGDNEHQLWITDGTADSTYMVKIIDNDLFKTATSSSFALYKNRYYFTSYILPNPGATVFETGGTYYSTGQSFFLHDSLQPNYPSNYFVYGSKLYFSASHRDRRYGEQELWVTDGTGAGTHMIQDLVPSTTNNAWGDAYVRHLCGLNGKVYFIANMHDNSNYPSLMAYDTTSGQFSEIIQMGNISSTGLYIPSGMFFRVIGNRIFFMNHSTAAGWEMWVSDGTTSGTHMIKDINPGSGSAGAYIFGEMNGKAIFKWVNSPDGEEYWVSDGTSAGTMLLKDIVPGPGRSYCNSWRMFNGKAYFLAMEGTNQWNIWESDGTQAGTKRFSDWKNNYGFDDLGGLYVFKNQFYFRGQNNKGFEMWKASTSVGMAEPAFKKDELAVYPNPCTEEVWIRLPEGASACIRVTDALGREYVLNQEKQQHGVKLDMSPLADGIYFVEITGNEGQRRVKKVVKSDQ